jgi:hypothetical protein
MLENLTDEIRVCLRHAEECARKAEEASKQWPKSHSTQQLTNVAKLPELLEQKRNQPSFRFGCCSTTGFRDPPRLIARERLGCEISPPNCSMKAWAVGKSEKHQR